MSMHGTRPLSSSTPQQLFRLNKKVATAVSFCNLDRNTTVGTFTTIELAEPVA